MCGPKQGAIPRAQGEKSWRLWQAGPYGAVSLANGVSEYAKPREEPPSSWTSPATTCSRRTS